MSTSSIDSIDITSTPTPTTKLSNAFIEIEHKEHRCQIPGCGEIFFTVEQLAIHQQKHKHEMKLRFGGDLSFMDDTPTPTRFLKLIEGGEFSDHEHHVSPFDHQFRKVTDITCTDLSLAIAKDAKYLNEMIPNGLPLPLSHISEPPYGSNISTSSTSTVNGAIALNALSADAPFPNCHLPTDDKLTLINDYAAVITREDISNSQIHHTSQKTSSSDSLQSDSISTTANSVQDMNMSLISDTPIKKKRGRKPIMDEDPVEKRKRYLERNRAAATRCRNKKKVWVSGLEDKLNGLVDENSHLKRENSILRAELSKFAPFKDTIPNFSLQLRTMNGLDGEQEAHDRLTGFLSAATIHSPSISQSNILSHPGILLPMTTSLNPSLYSSLDVRNHIPPSTQ